MWNTLLLTTGIIALAFLLLGIKVIFVKNGRFPDGHIASNEALKKKGLTCARSMDREEALKAARQRRMTM